MKFIVTGGSGFIGSHIVDKLIELGHEVIVIDNESSTAHNQFYYNDKAQYHKIDVSDYTGTRHLYEGVDYVFHLAAESRIQSTVDNPLLCFNTNVCGLAVVLQSAREARVRKVIYSSTSSAYGLKNQPPMTESMREDCLNPYSVSKVAGEKMCEMYTNLYGLNTITFRYFNVYGPREPIKGPYAPVIGLFLRQKKANETLTITGDGKQRRDFVHVEDVVRANILAMEYNGNKHGEVFNVGVGKNYSVNEIAQMISNDYRYIDARPGEARVTLANNYKITTEMNWYPRKKLEDYIEENL